MKRKVTREAVESAIQQIKNSGERITIERIRSITGGSPKTIGALKNAIEGNTIDNGTLPLFDSKPTGLSYHNIEEQLDSMIMRRVNTIVVKRLNTVLSRLEGTEEGTEEVKESPQPKSSDDDDIKELTEALGEMRGMWLEAVEFFSMAGQEVMALDKDFAQLEKRFKKAEQELTTANSRIFELEEKAEENDRTEKGQRVFKNELALAVRHLVMTVGMSQTDIAELLGLANNDVSWLKNQGTKLHRQRAKS